MNQAFDGGKMGDSRGMLEEHHPTGNIGVVQRWGDTPSDGILRDFDMENYEPLDFSKYHIFWQTQAMRA